MAIHHPRGVLGGARTMQWRERRSERIARQRTERAARQQAQHAARIQPEEAPRHAAACPEATAPHAAPHAARSGWLPTWLPPMNSNRWTALIIWLVGAYLTRALLIQVGVAESAATPVALIGQWLLTKAESPLWRGHGRPPIAITATLIDGGINAGGALIYTRNLGETDFWKMIQYAAQTPAETPALLPSVATQVALAIGTGLLVAAAAEYYWNLD